MAPTDVDAPRADLGLSPQLEKLGALIIIAAAIAAFGAVWAGELWLSNDGPQHLFAGYATVHYHDAALGYARYLELNTPPTSLGYQAFFTALEPLFGWRTAHRLTLAIAVELWGFGFVALVGGFSRRRRLVGVLGFPTAFQLTFFLGLVPFTVGSALGLFALAAWLRVDRLSTRVVVTSLLLYFSARAHVVVAAIAALLLAALVLFDERGSVRARVVALALCALPALLVLLEFCSLAATTSSAAASSIGGAVEAPLAFLSLADRVLRSFQVGPWWRGGGIVAIFLAGYLLSLRAPKRDQVLAVVAVVLCFAAMSLPRDLFGWQQAGVRFLPMPAMALIALIAIERLPRSRANIVAVLLLAYAASSLTWAAKKGADNAERHRFVTEPLAALSPKPHALGPAILDPCLGPCDDDVPGFLPGFHVGQLYAVGLGGVAALGHASLRSVHHVLQRPETDGVPPPDAQYWAVRQGSRREELLARLPTWLSLQEAVLVVGTREELQRIRDAGYVAELDTGRVFIGTFEGCRGRVEVEGGAGKAAHVGAWPLNTSAVDVTLDGDGTAMVERVPCGEVWLVVDGQRCAGAEPGLPLRTTWRFGAPGTITCVPATPELPP